MPYYDVTMSRTIKVSAGSSKRANRVAATEFDALARSSNGLDFETTIKDENGKVWTSGGTIKIR